MPANEPDQNPADQGPQETAEEAPRNPLEAIREAQAKRSLPPGTQPHGTGKGGGARGGSGKSLRSYNRHK